MYLPHPNYIQLTANIQPHHILKTKRFSEKVSSEGLQDIQGITLQFKSIFNKVPRHGNICVHGQNAYFQIMEDGKCLNLSENCNPSCSINTRISTWHVIVVYITVFSSIPEK
jgi:hypothetical protein